MEDLPFQNIEYTPAWYYKQFPGFYNIECYNILADYSEHPEKYVTHEEGVIETKNDELFQNMCNKSEHDDEGDEHVNKKCKICNEQVPV